MFDDRDQINSVNGKIVYVQSIDASNTWFPLMSLRGAHELDDGLKKHLSRIEHAAIEKQNTEMLVCFAIAGNKETVHVVNEDGNTYMVSSTGEMSGTGWDIDHVTKRKLIVVEFPHHPAIQINNIQLHQSGGKKKSISKKGSKKGSRKGDKNGSQKGGKKGSKKSGSKRGSKQGKK